MIDTKLTNTQKQFAEKHFPLIGEALKEVPEGAQTDCYDVAVDVYLSTISKADCRAEGDLISLLRGQINIAVLRQFDKSASKNKKEEDFYRSIRLFPKAERIWEAKACY